MLSIYDSILESLKVSSDLYYKLVLLTGEYASDKSEILKNIAKSFNVPVINISLSISTQLFELTTKQRALRLTGIFDNLLPSDQPLAIFDHIEILFDPQLQQDPLQLMKKISKNQKILASWNGPITNNQLKYAEPNHPEYRSYKLDHDFLFVDIDGSSSLNSTAVPNYQEES